MPAVMKLNDVLGDVVNPADMTNTIFAGLTDSIIMTGCSGRAQITATINESTGAFSMAMTFYSYDEYCSGEVISGAVAANGTMSMPDPNDPNTWEMTGAINMNFYALTFEDASESISFGGSWTVTSVNSNTEQIDFWYIVRDNNSGATYKMGDAADKCYLLITDNGFTDDILMDGVVYNPDYGWVYFGVDVTVDNFTDLPTSGTINVWDEQGSTALLTVPSSTPPYDYTITIDIVGSAPFDVDGYWSSN